MNLRWSRSLTWLLAVAVCSSARAQDSFMRAVPDWAKIVVKVDLREDSESVTTFNKYAKREQMEVFEQLFYGLAQGALMKFGGDFDIKDDVLGWIGRQGVIAVDPGLGPQKKEAFLALLEVRDAGKAKALFDKAMPALASAAQGMVKSATIGTATMWTIGTGKESVNFALSASAFGISDSADTIKTWLSGNNKVGAVAQRAQAAMAKVKSGLVSFYVDQAVLDSKEVLGGNPAQEVLKLRSVVGSMTYQSDGIRYEVAGLVADGSAIKKLAATIQAGAPRGFSAVPDDSMLSISITSLNTLLSAMPLPLDPASMLSLVGGQLFADIPPAAINAILNSEVALAVTKIDVVPGVAIALVGKDEAGAAQAFAALRGLAGKTGVVKLSDEQLDGKNVVKISGLPKEAGVEAIYAAQSGSRIVFASEKSALLGAVTAAKSLAANPTFQRVIQTMPSKSLLTLYADPAAIIQQAAIFGTTMGGVRNKYLDRAFTLIGQAFTFYGFSLGLDDDGLRMVSHMGIDYDKVQNVSAVVGLLAGVVSAAVPLAYHRERAVAPPAVPRATPASKATVKPAPKKTTTAAKKKTKTTASKKSTTTKK